MTKLNLESLPVELLVQILLYMTDLQSLRSIALSSTTLYQAYRLALRDALPCILQRQYDGLVEIHEAIAAVRSKHFHASNRSDRYSIIALLDDRRRSNEIRRLKKRTKAAQPLPDQPEDFDEILDLMRLHEIAVWLLDDYSRNASCPFWMNQTKWSAEVLPLEFSRTEKKRYFRAFYRLQTYCNIFGNREVPTDAQHNWHPPNIRFGYDEKWQLFFSCLAPWEVEEIGCLWHIFHDRHEGPYREIANDLAKYGRTPVNRLPKHLRILPSSAYELDASDLITAEFLIRECLAGIGPTFLYKLLQEENYMNRRNMVLANAARMSVNYPDDSPRDISVQLPLLYPADQFNFDFDVNGLQALLSTMPETERPNISWEKTWLENMDEDEPLYEEMFVTGVMCRRLNWGYALWDNERLSQWATEWGPLVLRDFAY